MKRIRYGEFSVPAHVRIVALPVCSYCSKIAPQCVCGQPLLHKPRTRKEN